MLEAKDLPQCELSKYLEQRILMGLQKERETRAAKVGGCKVTRWFSLSLFLAFFIRFIPRRSHLLVSYTVYLSKVSLLAGLMCVGYVPFRAHVRSGFRSGLMCVRCVPLRARVCLWCVPWVWPYTLTILYLGGAPGNKPTRSRNPVIN